MRLRLTCSIILVVLSFSSVARADCDLDQFVGSTLLAKKTIDGRIENGKRDDDFEGCDFGRVIVFSDGTGVRCAGYGYSYAYRPTAYIWSNGMSMKMCVGSRVYAVTSIR